MPTSQRGWYSWDVTDLVRALGAGEQPTTAVVLRDATGYADDHRTAHLRVQPGHGRSGRRPRLTILYNPDVPSPTPAGPGRPGLGGGA